MSEITAPSPPRVERLSPLPLAIAAVVLGGTLITAAVIVSRRTAATPPPVAAPPPPATTEPGFLARPPEAQGTFPVSNEAEILAALDAQRNAGNERSPEPGPGFEDGSFAPPPSGPSLPPPNPREEAYARALRSPLEVRLPASAPSAAPAAPRGLLDEIGVPHEPGAFQPPSLRDLVASSLAIPAASLPGAPAPEAPRTTPSPAGPTPLVVRFEPASLVPRLRAGTLIPALLLTAIHSDLPGDVLAQVERNIYDENQRRLVIPRGSRLLGRYENQLALGQNRLLIAWTQLQLPDGRSLAFPGLPAVARSGEAGLAGEVHNHTGRIFGTALLLSLITAGIQLSQPQESAAFGQGASARQVGAAAVGQELGSLATEILRRNLRIAPTIRLERGTPFHVFLNSDLVFEEPR